MNAPAQVASSRVCRERMIWPSHVLAGVMGPLLPAFLLILAIALIAPPAFAQRTRRHPKPDPVERELRSVRQMLKQAQPERAIGRLETLRADHPHDLRVVLLLGTAYENMGAHLKAAGIYRDEIDRSRAANVDLWIRLAGAYRGGGQGLEAMNTLLEAVRRRPGCMWRVMDQFELAVTDSAAGDAALEALRTEALSPDAPTSWREALAHVYVVTGAHEEALGLLILVDRERKARGRLIFQLAITISRRGEPQVALAAFDSVLALPPAPGIAEEAWFEKAKLLEEMERYADAAAAYEEQIEQFPNGALAMRARLRRAALLMDPVGDIEAAREAYGLILDLTEKGSQRKAQRPIRAEALFALGKCALHSGDFEEADSTFSRLEREAVQSAAKEQAAYERAEIRLYQGRFAEAEQAYYQLTDHYPAGKWVNDALARILLLGEFGTTAAPALKTYALALYEQRIGAHEKALSRCRGSLSDSANAALRGHLRAEEIRICGRLNRWADADSSLALLLEEDPESRLCPVVLLWMAGQAEGQDGRNDRAAEFYEQVILRYPGSLEAKRARARLRALRAGQKHS